MKTITRDVEIRFLRLLYYNKRITSRVCLSTSFCFLLVDHWTDLTKRRMATGPIVKHFQILENGLSGLRSGPKSVAIHAFFFDRSEKALHQRIIVTIRFF